MRNVAPAVLGLLTALSGTGAWANEATIPQVDGARVSSAMGRLGATLAVPVDLAAVQRASAQAAAASQPGFNTSQILQVGRNNNATVMQAGGNNASFVLQQGAGNVALVSQTNRAR